MALNPHFTSLESRVDLENNDPTYSLFDYMLEADSAICVAHGKDFIFLRKQCRGSNDPLLFGKRTIYVLKALIKWKRE